MLIAKAENFVVNLLSTHLNTQYTYHNLTHTQRVVEKATELADLCNITDKEKEQLLLAAWFHDTGFIKGYKHHEKESINIAEKFLKDENYNPKGIAVITDIIIATELNSAPKTLLEKIIRDADCSHIGSKNYNNTLELLRKEWELTCEKSFSEVNWIDENILFLTTKHKFYTSVAASKWEKTKSKNLASLLKLKKQETTEQIKLTQKKEALQFKKDKIELPERGIETMFRVTLKNHITLSNIADTKANILLSVNAIIVSLVLSNLVSKLDNASNGYLIIPTVIFVLFTVISIILSILATRPNITSGKFNKSDVANKKVNLLFFGNFHKMSLEDFEWAMSEVMKDRDYLYSSMKKDLYFLGLVLDRKYKILRITYTVFMTGIIVSVIAFAIAFRSIMV